MGLGIGAGSGSGRLNAARASDFETQFTVRAFNSRPFPVQLHGGFSSLLFLLTISQSFEPGSPPGPATFTKEKAFAGRLTLCIKLNTADVVRRRPGAGTGREAMLD